MNGQIISKTNCSIGCGYGNVTTTVFHISGTDVDDFKVSKTMSRERCWNEDECPQGNKSLEFEKCEAPIYA